MDLTEDQLVDAIRTLLSGEAPGVVVGIGDDAAVVETGHGQTVLTTDMLVEGVHFERSYVSAADLGYKSMVVNVSDIAAMGASPRHAVVSLALSPEVDEGWVVGLYGGMRDACAEYALSLIGGDLNRAPAVVVAVTVTGEVAAGRAVERSGARPGDRIVVTGELGASAGGLLVGQKGSAELGGALASEWARELVRAHLRPVARVGEGQTLAQAGASAMMDLSDGLAKDLSRLCSASGSGARVSLPAVPVAGALREGALALGIDPLALAISGGEDYELLATIDPSAVRTVASELKERFGVTLTDIGTIVEGSGLVTVDAGGREATLEPKGWDHFAER